MQVYNYGFQMHAPSLDVSDNDDSCESEIDSDTMIHGRAIECANLIHPSSISIFILIPVSTSPQQDVNYSIP